MSTSTETRICQSCQQSFAIEPEDTAFYAKMAVPAPTWCPSCRLQRRLTFTNEWRVFNKADDRTGQMLFSNFSPTSPIKVYDNDYWYSDAWDALEFGRDYDFARPFFEQFKELLSSVPVQVRTLANCENADYSAMAAWLRNCYMVCSADYTQDSAYVVFDAHSRNCFDTLMTEECELCHDSVNLTKCYGTFYSINCQGSRDVILSRDLIGCQNCFGCVNLRNKQYYIWNQPHTKDEYEAKLREFQLGSYQNLQKLKQQAYDFWRAHPSKFMDGSNNESPIGEYLNNTKNARHCWRVWGAEDAKYTQNITLKPCKEVMDYTLWGNNAELMYESTLSGEGAYNIKFCHTCWDNIRDLQYSAFCMNCKDLFGCVGLRKKQYCILNKQYTQEEYEELVPKIIEHMNQMPYVDAQGREYRYGEFFPAEISPFEYNVSTAQEHFPLTKDEATAKGYAWYVQPERSHEVQLQSSALPESILQATPDLTGQVINCAHDSQCDHQCTGVFTIIPQELAFLMEQGLPLPRLCFNCRHYGRMEHRRPIDLHSRQCQCAGRSSANGVYQNLTTDHGPHATDSPCPNTFETSFNPEKPDIVYCQDCYDKELI